MSILAQDCHSERSTCLDHPSLDLVCWLSKVAAEKHAYADSRRDPICALIMHGVAEDYERRGRLCADGIPISRTLRREIEHSSRLYVLLHFSELVLAHCPKE